MRFFGKMELISEGCLFSGFESEMETSRIDGSAPVRDFAYDNFGSVLFFFHFFSFFK